MKQITKTKMEAFDSDRSANQILADKTENHEREGGMNELSIDYIALSNHLHSLDFLKSNQDGCKINLFDILFCQEKESHPSPVLVEDISLEHSYCIEGPPCKRQKTDAEASMLLIESENTNPPLDGIILHNLDSRLQDANIDNADYIVIPDEFF
jgi:hypothetical protein